MGGCPERGPNTLLIALYGTWTLGSVTFLPRSQSEKKYYASPAELQRAMQRARCGSDGTGLGPPILPAALAAERLTRCRVGLHQDGRRAVLVHAAPERRNLRGFISLPE